MTVQSPVRPPTALKIYLDDAVLVGLKRVARREERTPEGQAAYLLRLAIERAERTAAPDADRSSGDLVTATVGEAGHGAR
jgi:hypothetical protein